MLTGELPFRGAFHEVMKQLLTQEPRPPSLLRPEIPPAISAMCVTALAKDPAARFVSMTAFADALQAAPTGPVPMSSGRGATRAWPRREVVIRRAAIEFPLEGPRDGRGRGRPLGVRRGGPGRAGG